jgi:hypothetical protein
LAKRCYILTYYEENSSYQKVTPGQGREGEFPRRGVETADFGGYRDRMVHPSLDFRNHDGYDGGLKMKCLWVRKLTDYRLF